MRRRVQQPRQASALQIPHSIPLSWQDWQSSHPLLRPSATSPFSSTNSNTSTIRSLSEQQRGQWLRLINNAQRLLLSSRPGGLEFLLSVSDRIVEKLDEAEGLTTILGMRDHEEPKRG